MPHSHLPVFEPLPAAQAQFLRERVEQVSPLSLHLRSLRERLLSIGGQEVVLPRYADFQPWKRTRDDYYSAAILARGLAWSGVEASQEIGTSNACHLNVAKGHLAGRGAIATGYALADDGLWREHSWLFGSRAAETPLLIETTSLWLFYYGCVLTPDEGRRFVRDELGPDSMP